MLLNEEINRIKNLMNLINEGISNKNIFNKFNHSNFKDCPPPADNSDETKKELNYLKSLDLKKKFVH